MAKKKSSDKDTDKDKAQKDDSLKPADTSFIDGLTPEMINRMGILQYDIPGVSAIFPNAAGITLPENIYGLTSISPNELGLPFGAKYTPVGISPETISLEQDLEDKINYLRKENRRLTQEIVKKTEAEEERTEEIEELKKNIKELYKKNRLQHLMSKVNESAKAKLIESEEFRNLFEKSEQCNTVVMAVDIRRSTELMLKAREPQLYADFIISLCSDLTRIILNNYGVFDKFTGDGILAFFPDFYSGEDSPYWALKAAYECHNCFSMHYQANRRCFISILTDVGLGIGIDYGKSHLVNIQDGITVIGSPVVYACRMSGAEAGQTLLNQPAYEVTSQKFGEFINFQESVIDIKHEGSTLAYIATLSKKIYEPKLPDWLSTPPSKK